MKSMILINHHRLKCSAVPGLFYLVLFLFYYSPACGQSNGLCQGQYYAEKEGENHLAKLQQNINSVGTWEKHAAEIRDQLSAGMGLEQLPKKTPLNPRRRNKTILNGYSVESVVFEIQETKNLSYFTPEELANLGKGSKIHQTLEDLTSGKK